MGNQLIIWSLVVFISVQSFIIGILLLDNNTCEARLKKYMGQEPVVRLEDK